MTVRLVEETAPIPCIKIAEWAEDIARRARSGEIVNIAFSLSRVDGSWMTGSRGDGANVRELVGELMALIIDTIEASKSHVTE